MDIKLTKKRLNNHLSYDWWKYIAVLLASIFFWSLLFTMTAPRLHIAKKMEIFFIVSGYSAEHTDKFQNELKRYLSDEIVEISLYNFIPNDAATSQVLTARISVQEGDLYVFPYSTQAEQNIFASYVDNGLFADFRKVIEDAKIFKDITLQEFTEKFGKRKEYNTQENLQKAWQECKRAGIEAEKLEGYINEYAGKVNEIDNSMFPEDMNNNLFYEYSRFTVYNQFNSTDSYPVEEQKIWGLNFNPLSLKLHDFDDKGFMYLNNPDQNTALRQPWNYAIGIVSFKEQNLPLYYENLAVINFFIENYYIIPE